jgi:hypothetical protein
VRDAQRAAEDAQERREGKKRLRVPTTGYRESAQTDDLRDVGDSTAEETRRRR